MEVLEETGVDDDAFKDHTPSPTFASKACLSGFPVDIHLAEGHI